MVLIFSMNIESSTKISKVIAQIDAGERRIATKINGQWVVDLEAKEAILAYFGVQNMSISEAGPFKYYDKIPLKFEHMSHEDLAKLKIRLVPGANIRYGSYIGPNTVIMPSFINIGAYIGENSMIDAQCTIGSCAQIGNHVHVGGGTGIGGVLEPVQANPTIIEDNCFIGARCEIAEGMIIGEGSVIGMGTFIGRSIKIYDRTEDRFLDHIPPKSVVVSGSVPSQSGHCHLQAAIIVKKVTEDTAKKVNLNEILHEF